VYLVNNAMREGAAAEILDITEPQGTIDGAIKHLNEGIHFF